MAPESEFASLLKRGDVPNDAKEIIKKGISKMEMLNTDHKLDSQYHHIFEDAPIPLLELDLAEPIEYIGED